jgi:hypothetical protein
MHQKEFVTRREILVSISKSSVIAHLAKADQRGQHRARPFSPGLRDGYHHSTVATLDGLEGGPLI